MFHTLHRGNHISSCFGFLCSRKIILLGRIAGQDCWPGRFKIKNPDNERILSTESDEVKQMTNSLRGEIYYRLLEIFPLTKTLFRNPTTAI